MNFRMKAKYWLAQSLTPETYDPELPVRTGSQAYKLRNAANEHFKAGRLADYKAAKKELFHGKKSETKKKNAPTVLTLELKHGDMVVMHGADIQKFYEVSVLLCAYSITANSFLYSTASRQKANCGTDSQADTSNRRTSPSKNTGRGILKSPRTKSMMATWRFSTRTIHPKGRGRRERL